MALPAPHLWDLSLPFWSPRLVASITGDLCRPCDVRPLTSQLVASLGCWSSCFRFMRPLSLLLREIYRFCSVEIVAFATYSYGILAASADYFRYMASEWLNPQDKETLANPPHLDPSCHCLDAGASSDMGSCTYSQ